MVYVQTMLPGAAYIHSNIALKVRFIDVLGLDNIPYSLSIKDFYKLMPNEI